MYLAKLFLSYKNCIINCVDFYVFCVLLILTYTESNE